MVASAAGNWKNGAAIVKKLRKCQKKSKRFGHLLARAALACIIKLVKVWHSRRGERLPGQGPGRETVGDNGKIQCQKAIHGPGGRDHGADLGLCGHHKDADEPAARRQHAVPDGGDGVSRCQPGARGERSVGCAPERAHRAGRGEDHRHFGRELQPAADAFHRGHGHEQRAGQGVQQAGSGQRRPAQHGADPFHHRIQPEHERLHDGGRQPRGQRCLRAVGLRQEHAGALRPAQGRRFQRFGQRPCGAAGAGAAESGQDRRHQRPVAGAHRHPAFGGPRPAGKRRGPDRGRTAGI